MRPVWPFSFVAAVREKTLGVGMGGAQICEALQLQQLEGLAFNRDHYYKVT